MWRKNENDVYLPLVNSSSYYILDIVEVDCARPHRNGPDLLREGNASYGHDPQRDSNEECFSCTLKSKVLKTTGILKETAYFKELIPKKNDDNSMHTSAP